MCRHTSHHTQTHRHMHATKTTFETCDRSMKHDKVHKDGAHTHTYMHTHTHTRSVKHDMYINTAYNAYMHTHIHAHRHRHTSCSKFSA